MGALNRLSGHVNAGSQGRMQPTSSQTTNPSDAKDDRGHFEHSTTTSCLSLVPIMGKSQP